MITLSLSRETISSKAFTIPLYIQIAERLISQIESGELSPGSKLAPERELSLELDVNRMTLRRALQVLDSQGLLERRHGIGNFIAHSKIDRQMESIFRFSSGMAKRGFTPGTKLISVALINSDKKLANDLGVQDSSLLYDILRLRSINQEPVMLESYKIPVQRFPGLQEFDLENRSIYEIFETEYRVKIARNRQILEPISANTFEAELLQITRGYPLMLEKRLSYDTDDQPVEYGRDRYRGDRFRFITETSPVNIIDE
jgi:GntR family transcriptional regulator